MTHSSSRRSFFRNVGLEKKLPDLECPPLPPGVDPGGHGGSHGHLMNEFIAAILQNPKPLVDVATALNMTVAGVVSHQSALKDGQLMKIPQFRLDWPVRNAGYAASGSGRRWIVPERLALGERVD